MSLGEASRNEPRKLTIIWGQFHGFREVAQNQTSKSVKNIPPGTVGPTQYLTNIQDEVPKKRNFLAWLLHPCLLQYSLKIRLVWSLENKVGG